jgi:hypothetical protein
MKRSILFVVLLLIPTGLFAQGGMGPGPGTAHGSNPIALVTSVKFTVTNSPGTSSSINTTGSTLLVAFVGSYSGGDTGTATMSDSKGCAWTALTTRDAGNPTKQRG